MDTPERNVLRHMTKNGEDEEAGYANVGKEAGQSSQNNDGSSAASKAEGMGTDLVID